ncbi:hypothetical protein [Streptomyces sp. NPDC005322]|uniref:hypothetical protein n=1 Tax=unclassified Streptomyces TaxID=2593676 RepID=UPI0033BB086A
MREDYIAHTVALVTFQRRLILALATFLPWGLLTLGTLLGRLALLPEARGGRPAPPAFRAAGVRRDASTSVPGIRSG